MEALVQELFPTADTFFFRHPSSVRQDIVQNFNHSSSFEDYPSLSDTSTEGESSPQAYHLDGDYSDATVKYITQMLMEEDDLEYKPCMFNDCMALQATEKYFSDALYGCEGTSSQSASSFIEPPLWTVNESDHSQASSFIEPPHWTVNGLSHDDSLLTNSFSSGSGQFDQAIDGEVFNNFQSGGKKNHRRDEEDEDGVVQQRSNKQLAAFADDYEPLELYDNVLLCPKLPENSCGVVIDDHQCSPNEAKKSSRGRTRGGGRKNNSSRMKKEMVDLRGLLTQCAQAMASYDTRSANELLARIREHATPLGDGTERLAHYLANALEARLSGTGTALYTAFASNRIAAAQILKAYKMYITASPFKLVSNIFANKYIRKVAMGASRLHIIDFGILYGFQWPCLIQGLSLRPGGPPELRITGIELPQPGFRPAGRVEDTGRRLEKYCNRFNVPFKFKAIAKKWENITLEELEIDRDEVLVVNSLYRLGNIPDETVVPDSPRDAVLDLIRRIRPDIFIHGALNGTFNTPFFATRFREALFHFSTLFDMFEATLPREDEDRKLYEEEVFARDAMNVIACEGTERVERPETYKQWQLRCVRAGFKQLPLDQDIMRMVKNKVRMEYHSDFSVDEDGRWMLQGWKGRVVYALSCWKPTAR